MIASWILTASLLLLAVSLSVWIVRVHGKRTENAIVLALFRIIYGAVLSVEIIQMISAREMIYEFSALPPLLSSHLGFFLYAWLISAMLLACGLCTRIAAPINYLLSVFFLKDLHKFEYHIDYIYVGVNFLLMFAPINRRWSLDSALGLEKGSDRINAVWPRLILLVGVALVYFDSVFYKLPSIMWNSGMGVWRPATMPQGTWLDFSFLLDQHWLMLFLGYLTLVFEVVFIFAIWLDRLRLPILLIGLGLHLGITIAFPIPLFGLAVSGLYVLLLPPKAIDWLDRKFSREARKQISPYAPSPFRNGALALILAVALFGQMMSILRDPLGDMIGRRVFSAETWNEMTHYSEQLRKDFMKPVLGIVNHGVFMDDRHSNTHYLIAVARMGESGEEWLPIRRPNGQVHPLSSGRLYVYWRFRVEGRTPPSREVLEKDVASMTRHWAESSGMPLESSQFKIKVKALTTPFDWAPGTLRAQFAVPWTDFAVLKFENNQPRIAFSDPSFM